MIYNKYWFLIRLSNFARLSFIYEHRVDKDVCGSLVE